MTQPINDQAICDAIEAAAPGMHYVIVVGNPATRELIQVGNVPPAAQKVLLTSGLKAMETTVAEEVYRTPTLNG